MLLPWVPHYVLNRNLHLAYTVVRGESIRVPELYTQVLSRLNVLSIHQNGSLFIPDGIEVVHDDTSAIHGLAILGEREGNVRIAASAAVLFRQSNSLFNVDPQDTDSFSLLLHVVAHQHFANLQRHGLWRDVFVGSGSDTGIDKGRDHWQIKNVDALFHHGNTGDADFRDTHESKGESLDIRRIRSNLEAETDGTDQSL